MSAPLDCLTFYLFCENKETGLCSMSIVKEGGGLGVGAKAPQLCVTRWALSPPICRKYILLNIYYIYVSFFWTSFKCEYHTLKDFCHFPPLLFCFNPLLRCTQKWPHLLYSAPSIFSHLYCVWWKDMSGVKHDTLHWSDLPLLIILYM